MIFLKKIVSIVLFSFFSFSIFLRGMDTSSALNILAVAGESIGDRVEMEDRCFCPKSCKLDGYHIFGVFDGHGGEKAAEFACKNLPTNTLDELKRSSSVPHALAQGFAQTEKEFLCSGDLSGSTAVMACIDEGEGKLYIASLGDSRATLNLFQSDDGVLFSTKDHKPSDEDEKNRIEALSGIVKDGRIVVKGVDNSLGVSRAIGDKQYKPIVTAKPDIVVKDIPKKTSLFMILASDGVFDVVSNERARCIVHKHLWETGDFSLAAKKLIDQAWICCGSTKADNMAAVVVAIGLPKQVNILADMKILDLELNRLKKEINSKRELLEDLSGDSCNTYCSRSDGGSEDQEELDCASIELEIVELQKKYDAVVQMQLCLYEENGDQECVLRDIQSQLPKPLIE